MSSRTELFRLSSFMRCGLAFAAAFGAAGAVLADEVGDKVEAQVRSAAIQHLQRQADSAGLREAVFDIAVVGKPAPACRQPVLVEAVEARTPSRMRFAATCQSAPVWRQEFIVRAHVSAKVVIARVAVPASTALTAADIVLERHDVTASIDAISDPAAVIGKDSRRALHAGDVLRQAMLTAPVLVKRGQSVMIVVRKQQVEISVAGEALETGVRGAAVRVRNISTGNVIQARVIGAGMVEPVEVALSTQSSD